MCTFWLLSRENYTFVDAESESELLAKGEQDYGEQFDPEIFPRSKNLLRRSQQGCDFCSSWSKRKFFLIL